MSKLDRADAPVIADYAIVHIVFELSKAKWKLGVQLPGSPKLSRYTIAGGDLAALSKLLTAARGRAERSSGKAVRIVSCYEAGYDGHWLHRWLTDHGVSNYEIDPSSIEVSRRARNAKTDRIDLDKLMRTFLTYLRGEPRACSMVHVPSAAEEDRKRRNRERDRLKKERTAHTNRIKGLLHAQGIRDVHPLQRGFIAGLEQMRTGDGRLLAPNLKQEVIHEHERLSLVERQLRQIEAQSMTEVKAAVPGSVEAQIAQLIDLRGLGLVSSLGLMNEAFYRSFENRRQVGAYFGLTGTPFDSGSSKRDQGISKAGNSRARALAVEVGWLWVQHQPNSELTRWFLARVGNQKGRVRRIAIVALTRKLMVALWRYVTTGVVPTGAVLRQAI
jgi:transposase